MTKNKSFTIDEDLHRYLVGHGTPPDEIAAELIAVTRERVGDLAMMQIAPEQGAFMHLLTAVMQPRYCVEIGTFTGYSALCVARAVGDGATLLCCDVSEEWTSIGRPFWERAGVANKIDLQIAPATETLESLDPSQVVDLAFIDADKEGYIDYYEALLPRLSEQGLILVDNVLWAGAVIDPSVTDSSTVAIRAFNDHVVNDPRSEVVMLAVSDGLSLIRRVA